MLKTLIYWSTFGSDSLDNTTLSVLTCLITVRLNTFTEYIYKKDISLPYFLFIFQIPFPL